MYTISFTYQPVMKVNIRNQCLNFKLTDRRCFNSYANWDKHPDWEVNSVSMTRASLIPLLPTFGGALMYQLQRKGVEFDDQSSSTYIWLFVAWKFGGYKEFFVLSHLMEYEKWCNWSEAKLEEYYQRYFSQLSIYTEPTKDKWLTRDGTVLTIELEADFMQRDGRLNITISEGIRDEHTKRAVWIDSER
jgi:hypothetical protein